MRWLIVLPAVSGCIGTQGDFCDVYTPVDMTRAGAVAIVAADRPAAERIAINEDVAGRCR